MTIYHRLGTFPLASCDRHPNILCFGVWRGGNTVTFSLSLPGPASLMQQFNMPHQALTAFEQAIAAADAIKVDAMRCKFCGKVTTTPCTELPPDTCIVALEA